MRGLARIVIGALTAAAAAACGGGKIGGLVDGGSIADSGGIADAKPQPVADVHLIGRFTSEAQPRFDWPGSGILTRTSDPTLAVTLTDGGDNTFEIFVDGKPTGSFVAQAGTHDYPVATGLPAGEHDLLISRRTETFFHPTTYVGMKGAVIATPGPGRFIEMVGDSITCGYGVLGPDESSCFSSSTESEAHAWGMLAANQLGAAHVAIAFSGKGVIRNGDNSTTDLVPALYERTLADEPAPWGFTGYTPDVVVVNLGTNDFAQGDPGPAFVTGYTAFAAAIRAHHPDAWIVIAQSPMESDDYPPGEMHRTKLNGYVDAVVAARKAAGDAKIDSLALDEQDANDKFACDYHPSLITHQKMAAKLVAKIRALTGW
jgi:lysophospholipase L1-like esterase